MNIGILHVCLCTACVYLVPAEATECVASPETRVIDSHELPCECWTYWNPCPLEEQLNC